MAARPLVRKLPGADRAKTLTAKIVLIENMRSSLLLGLPDTSRRRALALLAAPLLAHFLREEEIRARARRAPRWSSVETGIASWYGHPYHGRRAANGEIYDMEKLTAAHRTLPFDTLGRGHATSPTARRCECASPIAGRSSKDASSISRAPPRARST